MVTLETPLPKHSKNSSSSKEGVVGLRMYWYWAVEDERVLFKCSVCVCVCVCVYRPIRLQNKIKDLLCTKNSFPHTTQSVLFLHLKNL